MDSVSEDHVAEVSDIKVFDQIKCVPLNNQPYQPKPTLINLNPDELHYYQFVVNVNKCGGSFNIIDYLFCWM